MGLRIRRDGWFGREDGNCWYWDGSLMVGWGFSLDGRMDVCMVRYSYAREIERVLLLCFLGFSVEFLLFHRRFSFSLLLQI